MIIRVLFLLLSLVSLAHASQYKINVGDTKVLIKQYHRGCGKAFVHVHQNETTALKAAKAIVKHRGGSVLTLVHAGQRNIVFHIRHQRFEFDPNRIFTDVGIKKTLKQWEELLK